MELSVVIPVLNEEENIPVLYDELKESLKDIKDYEIILVDDGSMDGTFKVSRQLHEKDKQFKVIKFRKNYGQSAALAAGFQHANGDIIVSMDGDLQNDPHDIPKLIKKINEGYDVVSGWRYNRKDRFLKKISSRTGRLMRKLILGDKIHDSGCTLKAYRKQAIKEIELMGEMHRYISEILTLNGYNVTEIKVNHRARTKGKTKYNIRKIPRGFLDLLIIYFQQKYVSRPTHLFGGIGLLAMLIGFGFGVYLAIIKYGYNKDIGNRPLLLLSVLLIIIGIQFIIFGIITDILIRIYFRDGKTAYSIREVLE